ncbi:MAG: Holliday junction resolvase RuvX [Candidatus Fournierella pullistercoris]|uniref:Putative pre-16S rRNA nuclease n=1 Tax=Candidatus Allofournierella pullistercoris TaxID=2838597 RepID=A0A948T2V1_9FIRM|nr:Holliday junction resolvase RuvX [Candidatus Fournierella pullistercoris]
MKILAVDYGDARTGLAISDVSELLATPLPQIEEKSMNKAAAAILQQAQQQKAEMIVVGLPRNMDGTEGSRATKTRKMAAILERDGGLPVCFWDERRTTVTAAAQLSEAGTFGQKRKGILDSVSAAVILDSFLAWRKNHPDQMPQL